MRCKILLNWIIVGIVLIISAKSTLSYSQTRTRKLPDGTIIYADGTIKRTDGTIKRTDGTIKYPDGRIKQADGSVKYPDGTVRYPGKKDFKPLTPRQQKRKLFINDSTGNVQDK